MLVAQDKLRLRQEGTCSYASLSFALFFLSSSLPFSAKCKTRVRKLEKVLWEKGVCNGVLLYRKARAS